jgi:hypothetical protein
VAGAVFGGLEVENQQGDGYREDAIAEGLDAIDLHPRQARTSPSFTGRRSPVGGPVPKSSVT